MNSIDNQIEEQKKKVLFGSKLQGSSSMSALTCGSQKPVSFPVTLNNLNKKENNFLASSELSEKAPSKYQ